jgi:outer membrane protein assembly complex protein YaeT
VCAAAVVLLLAAAFVRAQAPPPPPAASNPIAAFTTPEMQNEGKIIADVRPRSMVTPTMSTEKITNMLQTRPGKPFSQHTLTEDYRRLMDTSAFRDVKYSVEPAAENKVIVNFFLYEYPSVVREIKYVGAKHFKDKDLDEAAGIRKGMPMSPRANQEACQKIMALYQEKGRMLARVILLEGTKPDDTRVVFNITEGPKAKIKSIHFVGHQFVTEQRLKTQLNSGSEWLGLAGGSYIPDMVDDDVRKIKDYYRSFGFHDVEVSQEVAWEEDQRHVNLTFHIHEGIRYKIGNITLEGNKAYSKDELIRFVKVKEGDIYNETKLKTDTEKLQDYEGFRGRNTVVHAAPFYDSNRPGEVDIHLEVQERPAAKVGQIIIVGNDVTKQNVILRQVPLYPGQVLSYPDLRVAEKNLQRLGIFNSNNEGVRPTLTVLDPDSDTEYKDVLITVEETQTGSLVFGVGVNSNSGLNGSIVLNERNFDITNIPTSWAELTSGKAFRGGGQEFRVQAMPGTQMQQYSASFREPYLFDTPYSFGTSLYYFQRFYLEYQENRVGVQFSLGRQINPNWSVNLTTRIEDVGIRNIPSYAPTEFQAAEGDNNFLTGFKGTIKRDTRDSYLRATEGSTVEASFEEVVGTYYFPSATLEGNKYFTLYQRPDGSGKQVLALRSMVGVMGSHAPFFERFYAGGFRTIRGFQFRGVGPNLNGFMTGGDFMFLNSAEYQIPVRANDQIWLVGFVDTGTVESSVEIRNYRVTVGTGVRFTVPMLGPMPIALDFGVPIVQAPSDRQQIFSFWMGFFH